MVDECICACALSHCAQYVCFYFQTGNSAKWRNALFTFVLFLRFIVLFDLSLVLQKHGESSSNCEDQISDIMNFIVDPLIRRILKMKHGLKLEVGGCLDQVNELPAESR